MSGEKRSFLQIIRDSFNSIRNQVYSASQHRQRLQDELNRARVERTSHIQSLQTQMDQRSIKYDAAINSLESNMRSMAEQHHNAIKRQRQEFIAVQERQRNELLEEIAKSDLRSDLKIEDLRNWTEESMIRQRNEYLQIAKGQQKEISQIKTEIAAINQREHVRRDRAEAYIRDLKKMIDVVDQNIPHQKFAPGKLDKIRRELSAAEVQLAEDLPPAVVATVQQAHFHLMDLEEEVLQMESEFNIKYTEALNFVSGLLKSVRQNRFIKLEEDGIKQEADYWTNNRYSELEKEVETIKKVLIENKDEMSKKDVEDIFEKLFEYPKKQEKLLEEAIDRIVSSQVRAEMGDSVINALKEHGFEIIENEIGYAKNDQRNPYLIKLENAAGTEVVTVISPSEETHQNILSVNTYGAIHNEEAEQLRNQAILAAFQKGGIEMTGRTECNPVGIKEFYNVEEILQENSPGIPSTVLKKAGMLNSQTQ